MKAVIYKFLFGICLSLSTALTQAGTISFAIEEPASNNINTGVGIIRGWAVCDACEIESIEAFIDGSSIGMIPYGGSRKDVESAFPDIENSALSGWSTTWSYGFHDPALEHELKIVVCDTDQQCSSKTRIFRVERFSPEFIGNPHAFIFEKASIIGRATDKMTITGIEHIDPLTGNTFNTVVTLKWDVAHQTYIVSHVNFLPMVNVNPTGSLSKYDLNGNGYPNYDNDGDGKLDPGINVRSFSSIGIDVDIDKNGYPDFDNDNNKLIDLAYFVPNLSNPFAYDIDGDGCPDYDDDCNNAVDFDANRHKIYDFSGTPIVVDIDNNGFPNFDNDGDGVVDPDFRI